MARRPRQEEAGAVFHVFARGVDRRLIFKDDEDRWKYLRLLGKAVERTTWRVLAFCLMDNHVHLMMETPEPNLGNGMRWFHGKYGRYFNDRHDRIGHLFQSRYGAVRQRTDEQMVGTMRYVVLNPVEAGLCAGPADYPWSSHRWMTAGITSSVLDVDRALWYLDGDVPKNARERYADLARP
jgi:REP element-mobilizing transposase RayT